MKKKYPFKENVSNIRKIKKIEAKIKNRVSEKETKQLIQKIRQKIKKLGIKDSELYLALVTTNTKILKEINDAIDIIERYNQIT